MNTQAFPAQRSFSIKPFEDQVISDFMMSSVDVECQFQNSYEFRLQAYIAHKIAEICEVESIYCQRDEKSYFVWIIINEFDPVVRRNIYSKQRELINMFLGEEFDFYVIARTNQPLDSVIQHGMIERIFTRVTE